MSRNYVNPLPGVPDVESPFFDELFLDGSADPQTLRIANDLHRDGFAIFDFPEADFDALAGQIVGFFQTRFDLEGWRTGANKDLRITDGWSESPAVRSLATNPEILALLQRLYGRNVFPFQTLNFPVGTQQHFHTDSVHFSSMPERFMVGVWIALEDVGPDQGPLIYYPGSHRWPVFTNEHIGHSFYENKIIGDYGFVWERLVEINKVEPKRFLAKKGQAAIWAANLLHGGDAQHDISLTRWSQVNHYFFENCAYYTPLMSDPAAGSVMFRRPVNILTGEVMTNFYNHRPVRDAFIDGAHPNTMPVDDKPLPDGFDPSAYYELNPDVLAADVDAATHYRNFGEREGRRYLKLG